MSSKVPLVRVEGKTYTVHPNLTMTAARFATAADLERDARDQTARDAEARYGLGACLYFYAGYACPSFGTVVLGYHPTLADGRNGNASSFDTGGMFAAKIEGAGLSTDIERDAHVALDLCDLVDWQTRLDTWVVTRFNALDEYLDGTRPHTDDATGRLHHPANDRRAWTYEVRLHHDVPLFDHLAFAIVTQDFLQDALARALGIAANADRLTTLIGEGRLEGVGPLDPAPCVRALSQIAAYAGSAGGT
jgi:hypothetical protein